MSYILSQLSREYRFMLRQKYILVLLICTLITSTFAVLSGLNEINQQQQTIARLKVADLADRSEAHKKHTDIGSLAYYTFHLTYAAPSSLAFSALGERDIYPWKHRIKMLALEGQIYESDTQNAELTQAGKIDFLFVLSALSPLLVILLFHDLFSSERASGRHDLLVSTAKSSWALWGARGAVRFLTLSLCLMLPFYGGAWISGTSLIDVALVSFWSFIYLACWTLLSLYWGKNANSGPRVASGLIGLWVFFAFVTPILGDLTINKFVHSPKGADIVLTQREAVNDAWDLPKKATMDAFIATHPKWKDYAANESTFEWSWYYAFQQVGDQTAEPLSQGYRDAAHKKYEISGYVSLLSPPLLLQRMLTRLAETDALAAFRYEQRIREFHQQLRLYHYPFMFASPEFAEKNFDKTQLRNMPNFEDVIQQSLHN
jgi:ABC-2 type transport system permease protein